MQIVMKPIGEVKPYYRNPRRNDDAVDGVAASIKAFGWRQPIIVDKDGVIVVGHTRLKAAKKLGLTEVPVHVATDLTPAQCQAYRLADNKTGEKATWDLELLNLEMLEINEFDMSDFGFEENPLKDISEDQFGEEFSLPDGEQQDAHTLTFVVSGDQRDLILSCIDRVYRNDEVKETFGNTNKQGNGLYEVARQWAEQKK